MPCCLKKTNFCYQSQSLFISVNEPKWYYKYRKLKIMNWMCWVILLNLFYFNALILYIGYQKRHLSINICVSSPEILSWPGMGGGRELVWKRLTHVDKCSAVAEMGDRLATTDMDRKLGACAVLRELGPHLTQCGLGRGLPPYQMLSWSIQPFGHNRHGPRIMRTQAKPAPINFKSGVAVHLSVAGSWLPM